MADRFPTAIRIGGELPDDLFQSFLELFEDFEDYPRDASELKGTSFDASDPEIAWGDVSGIDSFCHEHNLTYLKQVDPRYEFDGQTTYWKPGLDAPLTWPLTDRSTSLAKIWYAQVLYVPPFVLKEKKQQKKKRIVLVNE